jgi:hypothetical protein
VEIKILNEIFLLRKTNITDFLLNMNLNFNKKYMKVEGVLFGKKETSRSKKEGQDRIMGR